MKSFSLLAFLAGGDEFSTSSTTFVGSARSSAITWRITTTTGGKSDLQQFYRVWASVLQRVGSGAKKTRRRRATVAAATHSIVHRCV